jgi:hypothetical protein
MPPKKMARTLLMASVVVPKARPRSRVQMIW